MKMSKLWLKHQKFMKGNAGFSLVELIIVIAIMAALVAILAPQYLKYVEKSRETADKTQLDAVMSAVKVSLADPSATGVSNGVITLTRQADGKTYVINASACGIQTAVEAALGGNSFELKSTVGKGTAQIDITVAATTYACTWGSDSGGATVNPYPTFTA